MKNQKFYSRYSLAVLSGLLLAFAFPKFNFWWLVFVWPIPLLHVLSKQARAKDCFKAGWIAGFTAYLIIFYWVAITVNVGGGGKILAFISWVLLASYLALFSALFGVLVRSALKAPYLLIAPLIGLSWIFTEWLRSNLFGGFPWSISGYALASSIRLAQWAELGGVYLLGFAPVFLASLFWLAYKRNNSYYAYWGVVLFASMLIGGNFRLKQIEKLIQASPVKIAILQGSIDQYAKWDQNHSENIVSVYRGLYREARKSKPDLIIWPESAWPYLERVNKADKADKAVKVKKNEELEIVRELKREKAPHLVGVMIEEEGSMFNSALLIKEGEVQGRYDKVHLVPFGEYLPFGDWMRRWVGVLGNMGVLKPGQAFDVLQIHPLFKVGVTICYESIFPEITKELPIQNMNAIVNLTNDGWYLNTAAPYQHFQMNILRAIESRLPILRAANNGISAVIAPSGVIKARTKYNERRILLAPLPVIAGSETTKQFH